MRLLERGHRVRGTVRDPANPAKSAHLLKIAEDAGAADRLDLVRGDLLDEGSFDEAVKGSAAVCHTAAAVRLTAKDPQNNIVIPSVQGTANVVGAIERAGTVRRVVHLSSVAAVVGRPDLDRVYTESDWTEGATLKTNLYGLAKSQAERDMTAAAQRLGFELGIINPVLVIGPVYTKAHLFGSPSVVRDQLVGTFPGCPRFHFGLVDVRDVADASVNALEVPEISGRHILCAGGLWMREMALAIQRIFPDVKVRTRALPDLLVYNGALFDSRMSIALVRQLLGRPAHFDNRRSIEKLGVNYRPLEDSLRDTAQSMIDTGLVKPRR